MKKEYIYIIISILALGLTGCTEEMSLFSADDVVKAGDPVAFTTYVPGKASMRDVTVDNTYATSYTAVKDDYTFNVEMYQEGVAEALGIGTYKPNTTVTGEGTEAVTTYPTDGTLKATATPLYWPGNAKKYGFKATAGTEALQTDQSTQEKLLAQDKLLGYGFEPLKDGDNPTDQEDNLNYRTAKEWYDANKISMGVQADVNEYKKIPLYLKHQRSLITIKLKAGEGVRREDLAFNTAINNVETDIFSYVGDVQTKLTPFASKAQVDYSASDFGGEAANVETIEYTAVVEPYDYLSGATTKVIAEIRLSGQRFTFYASNDARYKDMESVAEAATHMQNYNLTAGKHLTITATLGRESRKILITAYVEDWTETVTTSIVDDYGQAGDPVQINTRKELREFLQSDKNKAGYVAIIVPNSLDLEQEAGVATAWESQPLNCTLNMAGATLRTTHRVFSEISSSGNLVNGTISVGDNATVDAAIANTNSGTIERVNVLPKKADGSLSTGKATRAGLVVTNYGSILNCDSELPVLGVGDTMVGGIAAYSKYAEVTSPTMPIIDGCRVNARVAGETNTKGGGIVGEAEGRVTNNTFEYGITIKQNTVNFNNIIQTKTNSTHELRAYNNAWPTTATNSFEGINNDNLTPVAERYTAVIDSEEELAEILNETYNKQEYVFRISNDFEVIKANGRIQGEKSDIINSSGGGNVLFKLDGNNKTITTDVMLFTNVMNDIYDLTIRLGGDMIAPPEGGNDVIAPLAYSVYAGEGKTVKISNVQVKGGNYRIQAATAAGLVVWAYGPGNAIIENCQVKASVQVWLHDISSDGKIYSGGIVANAARATITRCVYHSVDNTLYRNTAATSTGASVDENDTHSAIFFGGILGGTAPKGTGTSEKPEVLITDCTSWFNTKGSGQKGAIVGYAQYDDNGLQSGIKDGCQGNWWNTTSDAVGTSYNNMTDEQVIGRRNAVTPLQNTTFDTTN